MNGVRPFTHRGLSLCYHSHRCLNTHTKSNLSHKDEHQRKTYTQKFNPAGTVNPFAEEQLSLPFHTMLHFTVNVWSMQGAQHASSFSHVPKQFRRVVVQNA